MAFFTKYNVGSGGGGGVSDHGALTGLTDNDHPQYAPSTDWTPPPFQYKDADEITILAGRYHKGGHRLYGHYQNLTGMSSYWDVSANFDVDIDAAYSAGSTSGMLGGKVNSSWYSVWMVDSDELLVLPMIRVDTVDYNSTNAGKTTIMPAAHSDGTTAENGFLTADDQWNTYRLLKYSLDSNHGKLLTVEDCVDGTPDEIIIDGDQTTYISATDWFILIPPAATDCVYLGWVGINDSGDLKQFKRPMFESYLMQELTNIIDSGIGDTTPDNVDVAGAVPPVAVEVMLRVYAFSGNTSVNRIHIKTFVGDSGTVYYSTSYSAEVGSVTTNFDYSVSLSFSFSVPSKVRALFSGLNGGEVGLTGTATSAMSFPLIKE